jgi:rubredoxin
VIYHVDSYGAKCDGCGVEYENDSGFAIFVDKRWTMDELENSDDWFVDGDNCYCPSCAEKQKIATL